MDERTRERMELMNGGPLPSSVERFYDKVREFSDTGNGPADLPTGLLALILSLADAPPPVEPRVTSPDSGQKLTKEDSGRRFLLNGSEGTFLGRGPRGFYKVEIDGENKLIEPEKFHEVCELV
jgi:hypothetical protein